MAVIFRVYSHHFGIVCRFKILKQRENSEPSVVVKSKVAVIFAVAVAEVEIVGLSEEKSSS